MSLRFHSELLVSCMINLLLSKYKAYAYIGIFAVICTTCFGAGIGFSKMSSDRKIAELKRQHSEEILDREQSMIESERQASIRIAELNEQIEKANIAYLENLKHAQTKIDQLNACLKSGDCVLKPKVKACVSTTKTDNSGATVTETRAELDSETARDLVGITARCDEITLQLNALIDSVNIQ